MKVINVAGYVGAMLYESMSRPRGSLFINSIGQHGVFAQMIDQRPKQPQGSAERLESQRQRFRVLSTLFLALEENYYINTAHAGDKRFDGDRSAAVL